MTFPVIDADSHLTEPPDLWTRLLPAKYRDAGPHVRFHEPTQSERWVIGDRWCAGVGQFARAGWPEFPPSYPLTWNDVAPENYDSAARTRWMDAHGITAQVLYPNVVTFEGHALMALSDPELAIACIRAQNDYFKEFADQAPGRFILVANLPFWDREAAIEEMRRCAELGFTGVVWAATLNRHGLPATTDPHWDPFYAAAEEMEMSISFHVGVGLTEGEVGGVKAADLSSYSAFDATFVTTIGFMSNARMIARLILHQVCHKFPRLKFVSVESGFGYVPFLIETLDWQWKNVGGHRHPDLLLPSEYFRRQIFTMYWFEQTTLPLLSLFPENTMFETDMPHPTSLTPGAGSSSPEPQTLINNAIDLVGDEVMQRVLYANAAELYRYDESLLMAGSR